MRTRLFACVLGLLAATVAPVQSTLASGPAVLQVGSFNGQTGAYTTIQAAVNAARPGDWILIGPGDYHEQGAPNAGVLITAPGIHLRGMDRNGVIVDGTAAGFGACSANPAAQSYGPNGTGRDGIEVLKVSGVSIENLTTCNFLSDPSGSDGNQIWWNGGDGSGQIGLGSFHGGYLTASTTFFSSTLTNAAQYGIFVSNSQGPGAIEHSYASNMADSSFYVGACADCNATLRQVHAENSAQGYSGSNAGGHLVIEDSEWDLNRSGIVPSSLANDDPPSPQNGACPGVPNSSCTLIQRNHVHDNNNPNTPSFGIAATTAIGTGIDITGGRNDTVQNNLIVNNGAWGILVNDYPDPTLPAVPTYCQGGIPGFNPPPPYNQILGPLIPCYFYAYGNVVQNNRFSGNGSFGNPTNGDLANAALPISAGNCFRGNRDLTSGQPTSAPGQLQDPAVAGTCGAPWNPPPTQLVPLVLQVLCAGLGPSSGACVAGPGYPQPTGVQLLPIPSEPGLRDPCAGVPTNSWCPTS
jgi:parallel beta-helix repeat protein